MWLLLGQEVFSTLSWSKPRRITPISKQGHNWDTEYGFAFLLIIERGCSLGLLTFAGKYYSEIQCGLQLICFPPFCHSRKERKGKTEKEGGIKLEYTWIAVKVTHSLKNNCYDCNPVIFTWERTLLNTIKFWISMHKISQCIRFVWAIPSFRNIFFPVSIH